MSSRVLSTQGIADRIIYIRGQKVMLDEDLAKLYGVVTRRLNEQVKRNKKRFPGDFMFQLNKKEFDDLKSQFATSKSWGGRRITHTVIIGENGLWTCPYYWGRKHL